MRTLGKFCLFVLLVTLSACDDAPAPSGGGGGEDEVDPRIFGRMGEPVGFASAEQLAAFQRGREVAIRRFSVEEGLGPGFNVTFCAACHEKPTIGGSAGRYRDFLLVRQELPDGSQVNLGVNGVQRQFSAHGSPLVFSDESLNVSATRNPLPVFGVGLLAQIDEAELLARADPDDADGDGISGRPNWDRGFVGRFGSKGQTVSIEGFLRGPLFNHLGITSNPLPNARKNALPVPSGVPEDAPLPGFFGGLTQGQAAAPDEPNFDTDAAADPELSEDDLFDLVSFTMLLAAPRPSEKSEEALRGEALFSTMRCDACHVPALPSPRGLIPAYSDLLLHDMGEEAADGVRMAEATGSEFKTQPLWGLAAIGPYLHDGRADTIHEAIVLHGGEGTAARDAYLAATETERDEVLAFLLSLGGTEEASPGLVPAGTPIPGPGEDGRPDQTLSEEQQARFLAGRDAFDLDRAISAGLGPRFNGDSCRACHFDPVVGGAGPNDVNVIRQAIIDDGVFTAPAMGTMAHRHATNSARPPIDAAANLFEARQTPSILGLGRLTRVPEEAILSREDPDDADGDGISGRAHRLADGRLGRLGWKAGVPDLKEFARDAMFNELGLTLPAQEGLTFGATTDDDGAADPELPLEELEALAFYLEQLAPPVRRHADADAEARGEALFSTARCDACHVPSLPLPDGGEARAYTDLLLHDVAPADALGIEDGLASMREFRTPPLWGVVATGPYMHDGRAETLAAAVAAHFGEADESRLAVEGFTAEQRADLYAFLASL